MSLVAFKARNHPQQEIRDDVDDRAVMPDFFAPLHAERQFTVDAAASGSNALLPTFWTREDDALRQSWDGHRVWCNPPYSGLEPWVEKAWVAMVDGACESVTMLLPANRCEQGFWQRHVEPYRDADPLHGVRLTTRFLPGRMRFGFPASRPRPLKGDRPPFGCVLLTWARVASRVDPALAVDRSWSTPDALAPAVPSSVSSAIEEEANAARRRSEAELCECGCTYYWHTGVSPESCCICGCKAFRGAARRRHEGRTT